MSMVIAHNLPGMNVQRQFGSSARGMSGSMEKLSSGFKINTGKDDPSGLLISEKLRSQMNGITRAKQNTEEAMNVMGIAEGAMNEMNNILKKMKSLATHAANTGVTTSDQTEADQAELDSAIQTLDRIAQTTEFSGEKLLNGNKELSFESTTAVMGTQQNQLLNVRESTFNQIFKRDGYSVSIGYTGATENVKNKSGVGDKVDFSKQATKAYMEVDTGSKSNVKAQINDGKFTQEQVFTLTGSQGSRQFTFGKNSSVADMVKDIHSTAGSTGVDAALIFNSDQKVSKQAAANSNTGMKSATSFVDGSGMTAGAAIVFGNESKADGDVKNGVSSVDFSAIDNEGTTEDGVNAIQWGKNTDGQGNIYVKFISDTEVELYKDSSMSRESLVGVGNGAAGTDEWKIQESNNSGLGGLKIKVAQGDGSVGNEKTALADLKGIKIATGGINGAQKSGTGTENDITWSGNAAGAAADNRVYDSALTTITGVELGKNTDENGKLYFKTVMDSDGKIQAFAYKDEKMEAKDLVAQSDKITFTKGTTKGLILNEVRNSDNTAGTGLSIAMGFDTDMNISKPAAGATKTYTGNATFNNLGARIFANDYGSENYVKVTQDKGAIFTSYDSVGESNRTLLDAGEKGATKLITGQDATISVNGMEVKTNGLELKVATQDIQADLTFNGGKVGSTTIAQVGYDTGSLFTKAGQLNNGTMAKATTNNDDGLSAYLCNAGHNTSESVGDFEGGMQLQLGEGAGDQNRTTVSMRSMTSENLGRIKVGGYWDTGNPSVYSEKQLTLKDAMGGGAAALRSDPTLTMRVIDQAIDDVATQRAVMGAQQSNLLQTNANNLEVTLENITKTESGIRDTDMASEMAEFTKNQVLQNAAMSMMSQANSQSQNALQLLR